MERDGKGTKVLDVWSDTFQEFPIFVSSLMNRRSLVSSPCLCKSWELCLDKVAFGEILSHDMSLQNLSTCVFVDVLGDKSCFSARVLPSFNQEPSYKCGSVHTVQSFLMKYFPNDKSNTRSSGMSWSWSMSSQI